MCGELLGEWNESEIRERIVRGNCIIIAEEDGQLLGSLLTGERDQAKAAPVLEMLKSLRAPGQAHT